MTKIDIFSGFLGAGKTTLIKKLIKEAYASEKVVLIENEFGEIGVDSGFLQEAGVQITEMNSGCICCSLVGDFSKALKEVYEKYAPDRIVIEVGKLSDVIKAVSSAHLHGAKLNAFCTVVDASKCKMYMKNFGEFFNDQVQNASCIVLSHTAKTSEEKLALAVQLLREKNATATLVTAEWDSLDGNAILATIERKDSLQAELDRLSESVEHEHHHHHHDGECCHEHHGHHHHEEECDDPHCHCHDHHEHEHHHGGECCHEHHEHHHKDECDDPNCSCHHHGHGHHHADDVFTSWGVETTKKFTKSQLESVLQSLANEDEYGTVLRAKGIVEGENGWLHFDYVPSDADVREGCAAVIGRLCVIGCRLQEDKLKELFNV